MKDPLVLVLVSVNDNNDKDLDIIIVSRLKEPSGLITLSGRAAWRNGNPYGVYGDAIADYLGVNKFDVSIKVYNRASGGDMETWE